MIGTIRRHQQWLWIVIILAIIISFVVYFSPNSGSLLEGDGSMNFGSIKNREITQEEYSNAYREIQLFYFLRTGRWPDQNEARQTGFDIDREAYTRLAINEKMKEMEIQPSTEATARWIAEIFRSAPDQPFPMERFQEFVTRELQPQRLTADDFYRFARHQVGQQHLLSVMGLAGKLITPAEAESFYRRANQPLSTEAVFFSATNFLSKISETPAELGKFYTNNMAQYRLPERMQVNYVKWSASNYLAAADKQIAQITNLSQRLDAIYAQRGGTNTFMDKDGKPLSMEEAKKQIKEEQRRQLALVEARKDAADFVTELQKGHDEKNPFKPDDLEKLAKARGLEVKTTPPFTQENGTELLDVPPTFVRAAFNLQANDPEDPARERLFSSSYIDGEDAVYVIGLNKRIPSEIQPFETVRAQVVKDYREQQSLKLARDAGIAFGQAVTNGIAQGKTFSQIASEQKVKPEALPQFTLSAQSLPQLGDRVTLDVLQNVASTLSAKEASGFVPTRDGGFVLHMKEKLPVDEAKLKAELPEFLSRQREQRAAAAFSEWLQKLPQEMNLVVPANSNGNS